MKFVDISTETLKKKPQTPQLQDEVDISGHMPHPESDDSSTEAAQEVIQVNEAHKLQTPVQDQLDALENESVEDDQMQPTNIKPQQ